MLAKNRIEAFSDGVIAIIITIMAFDLKLQELPAPFTHADVWKTMLGVVPKLLSYSLSFIVLAIMWLNHHSMFDRLPHSTSKQYVFAFCHVAHPHAHGFFGGSSNPAAGCDALWVRIIFKQSGILSAASLRGSGGAIAALQSPGSAQ